MTVQTRIKGFTLIELITVIIIIGILSVTVMPKFFSSSGYEEYTYRSEIISLLRSAQLKASQQVTNRRCNSITITANKVSDDCGKEIIVDTNHQISFSTTNSVFGFDHQGLTAGEITITVSGAQSLVIVIESQGYIHAI